jgi:glycine dehydrogenase
VLLAVMASMYAVYHGPRGCAHRARVQRLAAVLRAGLRGSASRAGGAIFDTVTVDARGSRAIVARCAAARMNFREVDGTALGISLDETTTRADVEAIWGVFAGRRPASASPTSRRARGRRSPRSPANPPTSRIRCSTRTVPRREMLRYLRALADKDVALDRSMIPLGSCTMKLNATSEMIPVGWQEFAHIHPFAPAEQWRATAS